MIAFAAAVAIVAAGCSPAEPGVAAVTSAGVTTAAATSSTAGAAADALTTTDLDVSTIDPCSLVDPVALEEIGTISAEEPLFRISFDTCLGTLSRAGSPDLILGIGPYQFRADIEDALGEELPTAAHGAAAMTEPLGGEDGGCGLHVVFADDVLLRVVVEVAGDDVVSPPACDHAETVAASVIAVLTDERFERFTFEDGSLAAADPCDVLLGADFGDTSGLEVLADAVVADMPSGHQCVVANQDAGVTVSTTFGINPDGSQAPADAEPTPGDSAGETIAGRATSVDSDTRADGAGTCVLSAPFAPFPQAGPDMVETVSVVVLVADDTPETACAIGRAFVAPLWTALE